MFLPQSILNDSVFSRVKNSDNITVLTIKRLFVMDQTKLLWQMCHN